MNIALINLSGNVGKSTLAVHLFAAMRPGAKIISVESVNASDTDTIQGIEVEEIEASSFREIFKELMMAKGDVILDVGASNVTRFMSEMKKFKSAVHEIDLIVVPVVPQEKQQRDTISTLEWLAERGFDPKKIRVVFNQFANDGVPLTSAYGQICGYLETTEKRAMYKPEAVIVSNDLFDRVKGTGKTIRELSEDKTDWRAKRTEAREAGDITGMEEAVDGQMNRDLAQTAQENLSEVWKIIGGGKK
jgi:coenzyme F420-reducing hydrogenase delta subunit